MLVRVRVKPNARQARIEAAPDGGLTAWLKSPPVEGRANAELIELLAERFRVPRSEVRIRAGRTGRSKLVEIG